MQASHSSRQSCFFARTLLSIKRIFTIQPPNEMARTATKQYYFAKQSVLLSEFLPESDQGE